MHPLHDYVAKQLASHLKEKGIVVWYDVRREFSPFIIELRGREPPYEAVAQVETPAGPANLAEYRGSFFELRALLEPFVAGDEAQRVVVYVPGVERDHQHSVLMEMEKAGEAYEPQLKRLARNVLRQRYTDGTIDELLAPEGVSYGDLTRALADTTAEPPSMLKAVFHEASGNEAILAEWLVKDQRDADIQTKGAATELAKLIRSRLGLEVAADASLAQVRSATLRYVLVGEFRADLRCTPPASLASVPGPKTKEHQAAVRELAGRLRKQHAEAYTAAATRVEKELGLPEANLPPEALGSIDTFPFEERALLEHCGALLASKRFAEARALVVERETSFWLSRDFSRKAQWEACKRMADLGALAVAVQASVSGVGVDPAAWVDAYASKDGWQQLDQAQRRLETLVTLVDEPTEKALGVVRRLYEDTCNAMAEGFSKALANGHWTIPQTLHQTQIFSEVVSARPKPVAYFFVDAMRYEMGLDLVERLPRTAEVSTSPAISVLPSITPLGMAALLPGAAASFSVVAEKGKLGARIDETFLPDLAARKKLAAARIPHLVDLTLDELLSLVPSKLAKRLEGAQVVIVRSQEIDHAGEGAFSAQAWTVMDNVLSNLARAIGRLSRAGVEHAVVTADHGHFFFSNDRDESMRTDSPGGQVVELHRRCWIGKGGATPPACIRVDARALGYDSDLEFVFPVGSGVFKAGGDLAFHHGGASLQEMVVPVISVRLKQRESGRPVSKQIEVTRLPDVVTNRIFSVSIQLGGSNLALFASAMNVRPTLMADGRQVGTVGMAVGAPLDAATGCITLHPARPVTVAFRLLDENVSAVRVVIQDPTTDADLYRSPKDIPVRLGV
jgi:hypothetical protein